MARPGWVLGKPSVCDARRLGVRRRQSPPRPSVVAMPGYGGDEGCVAAHRTPTWRRSVLDTYSRGRAVGRHSQLRAVCQPLLKNKKMPSAPPSGTVHESVSTKAKLASGMLPGRSRLLSPTSEVTLTSLPPERPLGHDAYAITST